MAERRMFSKKIINSAKFIKMPNETQSLYFHLGINADDDGIVEAYTIMRLIGATEDSLKILSAKGFVRVLNDDLVTHLTDWGEHNLIRADRKVDSIYKDLLLEIVPDTELIIPKQRADRQRDVPRTTKGQHRIGKDRVGEVSIVKDNKEQLFDLFWKAYPRKSSKQKAKEAFMKPKNFNSMPSIEEVINKIDLLKVTDQWRKDGERFIPHPASWLNAHGWEDEVKLTDNERRAYIQDNSDMSASDIRDQMIGISHD